MMRNGNAIYFLVILPASTLRHVLPEPDENSMWTAVYIVKYVFILFVVSVFI